MDNGALARTEGGLFIPAATLDKRQHVMTAAAWKKFRQAITFAREHAMIAMFFCRDCEQPIALSRDGIVGGDPAEETPATRHSKITLACGCSSWTIR